MQNFYLPFVKVAQKLAYSASSPEAEAPAAAAATATGSASPTPPPPPSLCPAPTSCPPSRGARLTHPSSGVGGWGGARRQAPPGLCPRVPARGRTQTQDAPSASCRPPPQPGSPRPPPRPCVCASARVPPRLTGSRPPGASLPRWGNWGPGLAHAPAAPRAPQGGGLGNRVFSLGCSGVGRASCPPSCFASALSLTFAETRVGLLAGYLAGVYTTAAPGPRLHLRAPRVNRARRMSQKVLPVARTGLANPPFPPAFLPFSVLPWEVVFPRTL